MAKLGAARVARSRRASHPSARCHVTPNSAIYDVEQQVMRRAPTSTHSRPRPGRPGCASGSERHQGQPGCGPAPIEAAHRALVDVGAQHLPEKAARRTPGQRVRSPQATAPHPNATGQAPHARPISYPSPKGGGVTDRRESAEGRHLTCPFGTSSRHAYGGSSAPCPRHAITSLHL
jgi:hypothetical protein